ncbi:hypothetical protein KIN34_04755 [Cellulomonas sp. DKR-3]|uniref:Baseplate protein J-like domain-containing protein n=1 Tax=Cellulomonas fulva TaxID=2835530 RepID=A0ABS5TWS4_9CELL|nr:hypothetical protein [Cellulomonas fulva]MBT0993595.1 hypothetical protein [Cellulomonas fulva]
MTTARVLLTALPRTLDETAEHHLTAYVTHKLETDGDDETLAAFPAVADWVTTLQGSRLELVHDAGAPVPLTVVSVPDQDAWAAVLPPTTRVAGYPKPAVAAAPWESFPAHRLSDHAVDLHLMSLTANPTHRPPVLGDPVMAGFLDRLAQFSRSAGQIRELAQQRATRGARLLARRTQEAQASLGATGVRGRPAYVTDGQDVRSPIEVLLADTDADERVTTYLDGQRGVDHAADPELQLMADAHAARRYYERPEEQTEYREHPVEGATLPRPDKPDPDFHQRAAHLADTPALLRPLGLALDLRIDSADDRAALARATWVAVRLVTTADVVRLAPPRTQVVVRGDRFDAVSSDAWVGGAVPLGDDSYVVLDLDPDASGLKLDQHVRSLPALAASETNGDETSSAPGTLRTSGFGIARTDRVGTTRARVQAAEAMTTPDDGPDDGPGDAGPLLRYDDLVRGLRLEVWDDRTRAWHSLHERRVDVTADPGTGPRPVLTDAPDVGFLQLSGLNRVPGSSHYYLHEVVAGWDGWSLSAPRPGRVIVDEVHPPAEVPEDAEVTGVHVTTRVEPGSLPRLRWGWSYAFRLVGVDLAGGSVPRTTTLRPLPERLAGPARSAAREHLDHLRDRYAARDEQGLLRAVRDRVLAALPAPDAGPGTGAEPGRDAEWLGDLVDRSAAVRPVLTREELAEQVPAELRTGDLDLDAVVGGRLVATRRAAADVAAQSRVAGRRGASARGVDEAGAGRSDGPSSDGRSSAGPAQGLTEPVAALAGDAARSAFARVAAASRVLAAAASSWRVRPQLAIDPDAFADLAAVPDLAVPDEVRVGRRPVVTTPRPYLRWTPVPPPTLVAQAGLGTGEQLARLVVRTGLPDGHPDAITTSARHVVPPKATQLEAETDGKFDLAIGSTDADVQKAQYAIALAERGTLLDRRRPSLDDANATEEQPGIALLARPGADPDAAVTLDDIEARRDTPLGEGQYVVHGTDELTLPYLPDPHAAGVALVFYDAGAPHLLPEPRVLQAVVLPFPGDWPRVEPLRLVLERGETLGARLDGRDVRVTLPPGEQVRVAMSSSLRGVDLDDFGLWRSHLASTVDPDGDGQSTQEQVIAAAVLLRAAVAGWTWWLTPATDLRLVHAVPAPVLPPHLRDLRVLLRPAGLPVALLGGLVDVHGPSTDQLVVRASWTEWVDDVAAAGPVQVTREDVVVRSTVWPGERLGLLWLVDHVPSGTDALGDADVGVHQALQTFPDTHHREVTYTPSGTTRYAELFAPEDVPAPDDPVLAGAPRTLTVLSSARPAGAEVVDTVPLLRWETGTEPDQPFAVRRVRRSGVRVWLRRPWFSSGDGELLGVLVGPGSDLPADTISLWGRDPIVHGAHVAQGTMPPLVEPAHLSVALASGGSWVDRPARPARFPATVPLLDVKGRPGAQVYGYRPEFHPDRGQWYVDVALDDGPALWPFVRLAVARYQPSSIADCELSPVGLTAWAQPLPTRTATVSRPDPDHVRVTVTGAVGFYRTRPRRGLPVPSLPDEPADLLDADTPTGQVQELDELLRLSRVMRASVQVLDEGASDLQWRTVATRRLPAVGFGDETTFRVTWTGELPCPGVPLATPGSSETWRVLVEESELLDADAPDAPNADGRTVLIPRTVYLDSIPL